MVVQIVTFSEGTAHSFKYHNGFGSLAANPLVKLTLPAATHAASAPTRATVPVLAVAAAITLAGCSAPSSLREYVPQIVTPYRIDIQQGNFVTQDMVEKLQVGQTRDQVRFILGTPMLTDVFHAGRWDYVFRSAKGWNDPEKRRLTVFFDKGEKLEKWEAIAVPPPVDLTGGAGAAGINVSAATLPPEESPGFFGRLFGRTAPLRSGAGSTVAAATAPAPSAPSTATPAAIAAPAVVAPAQVSPSAPPPPAPPAEVVAQAAPVLAVPSVVAEAAPAAPAPPAAQVPTAAPVPPPVAPAPASAPKLAAAPAEVPNPGAITALIEQWRAAWSGKNVEAYLALYAPDFKPAGLTRARWEGQRKERLTKPVFIFVNLLEPQITMSGDKTATAVFTQTYESDTLKETGRKTLVFGNVNGMWLIRDESFKAQ